MAVNKVVFGNTTVMDITDSTVTASKLKSGETAYAANGAKITGELIVPEVLDDLSDVTIVSPENAHEIYYDGNQWINYGAKILLAFDDAFQGQTITLVNGQTTITKTAPLTGNSMSLYINETGEWTISSTIDQEIYETVVTVTTFGLTFDAELSSVQPIPKGSTVTPTDDIQTWLACANITDKAYTTLAEVLADEETYETLLRDSNACDYMARSTSWAYKGLVPIMTSNTTPEGECFASSVHSDATLGSQAWNAFDRNFDKAWHANTQQSYPQSVGYKFVNATEVKVAKVRPLIYQGNSRLKQYKYQASNDNSTWVDLTETLTADNQTTGTKMTQTDCYAGSWVEAKFTQNIGSYLYYRLVDNSSWDSNKACIVEVQFYSDVDITTDQDAMALIGKYDYCATALLSNATWAEAIANSDYISEILPISVPTMTSDTAPSGNCISISANSGYEAYKAFDNNDSTYWGCSNTHVGTSGQWVGYKFTTPVNIRAFSNKGSSGDTTATIKVQYSDDGITWNDTGTVIENQPQSQILYTNSVNDSGQHLYWRIFNVSSSASNRFAQLSLQFYGRASKEVLVPLVPTMTSNTTPLGEVLFDSGQTSGGSPLNNYYYLFNNVLSDSYIIGVSTATQWQYFGYDSGTLTKINSVGIYGYYTSGTVGIKVQAYDGSDWIDVADLGTYTQSKSWQYFDFENDNKYSKWRIYCTKGTAASIAFTEIQFYQRTVQTNIVHSSANDTIYYMEDGSPVIVATTNSDGDGVLDFSSLEDKEYTFYSSVAKDPSNLSNDFSKTIRITKSQWGGTTELYLMPSTINTLYWYGNNIANLSGQALSLNSGNPAQAPTLTFNTNSLTATLTASGRRGFVVSDDTYDLSSFNSFKSVSEITQSTYSGYSLAYFDSTAALTSPYTGSPITLNEGGGTRSEQLFTANISSWTGSKYCGISLLSSGSVGTSGTVTIIIKSLWLE